MIYDLQLHTHSCKTKFNEILTSRKISSKLYQIYPWLEHCLCYNVIIKIRRTNYGISSRYKSNIR